MAQPDARARGRGRGGGERGPEARPDSPTAALLRAVTAEQVAQVVLAEGRRAVGADFGVLYQLRQGPERLGVTCSIGIPEGEAEALAGSADGDAPSVLEAVRAGAPLWLETRAEMEASFPAVATAAATAGADGLALLPLGGGEELQGAIAFGFRTARIVSSDDRDFLTSLAEQCALALERARLYEAERYARRASERLQALTEALSEAATEAAVAEAIMRQGVSALGAYAGVLALEVAGAEELEITASIGYPAEACMGAGRRWQASAPIPIAEANRTGTPVFLGSAEEWARHFQTYLPTSGSSAAWAAIPLRFRDAKRGALLWTFDVPREFSPTDRELMTAIARQGMQALERAWLFDAETRARAEAERAVRRISRLQELTAALASALTPEHVARAVVEHGIAALDADGGGVVLASRDGSTLSLVDSAGFTPELLERWAHFPASDDVPLAEAFRTGEPIVLAAPAERRQRYPQINPSLTGYAASASVPLLVDGEAVGAMGLVFTRSVALATADREFMLALGRLCAQAVRRAALYAEVKEANQAKADFLATMSHELRTPLTAVIGYEELLAEGITGPVTEAQRAQLHRIKASAMHLLGLIDEVLTFARVEAGTESVHLAPIGIATAMERAAELVAPMADERGLELRLDPPREPVEVVTDAGKLQQVLVNLLSNAVKFTDRGSVRLDAAREDDAVVLRIRDSGIGIAGQDLDRIFEPFTQVESATTRRFGGTGLGLSVCRKLLGLLGGEISVASTLGEGSTFAVRLPLQPPA